ncbi:hypothetical protein GCM10023165_09660 [Variovorax defluvii]|uniref:Uncharacterized protein n=1 Tax=Variovorax defluvii TaxID=913761 RepID=A0ABP8H4B4_9BURK
MGQAENGRGEPVGACLRIDLEHARPHQRLGQPAHGGSGQACSFGDVSIPEQFGAWPERTEYLYSPFERAIGWGLPGLVMKDGGTVGAHGGTCQAKERTILGWAIMASASALAVPLLGNEGITGMLPAPKLHGTGGIER